MSDADRTYWKWFHVTAHTYGAWPHGDPRGFRTRRHREHVDGDYRNPPPPGAHGEALARSKALMVQAAVALPVEVRGVVGLAMIEMLQRLDVELLTLGMGATHLHMLARMPGGPVPREWVGRAKKHSNFIAKEHGWVGKLWAVRCKVTPIRDYGHHLNTYRYIQRHRREGAWVWDFRAGVLA